MEGEAILTRIYEVLLDRKRRRPPGSYTASLFARGEDALLRKVGEEACEVVLASKSGRPGEVVHESADLLFHLLVLLAWHEIPPERIFEELKDRSGKRAEGDAPDTGEHTPEPLC